jgi:hypothetical protein
MTTKFKKLKEQLTNLEEGSTLANSKLSKNKSSLSKGGVFGPKWLRYLLFSGFLAVFILYAGIKYVGSPNFSINPVNDFTAWVNQPNQELLEGMGSWMEEMGYTGLSNEDLIELREQGVTATFTSRIRDLGYTDLTLDEVVMLAQNDVSSRFAAMMKELGYNLTVEELVDLRQHNVTAYFTSNMHDLGYTDITQEELIRLKDTGVSTSDVKRLVEEREEQPSVEDIIRYHISNQ